MKSNLTGMKYVLMIQLCYNSIDFDILSRGSSCRETYFTIVNTWFVAIGCDSD